MEVSFSRSAIFIFFFSVYNTSRCLIFVIRSVYTVKFFFQIRFKCCLCTCFKREFDRVKSSLYPCSTGGGIYCFTSVRPSFRLSKIFFVAFFSATIDGRNLIFGHKLHIGMPYCGKRFWTRQIPTSCLPT